MRLWITMNIFLLDYNIKKCAEYHCDKHVVKMILESAQILSTVCRMNNIDQGYNLTHQNHPCTKWVSESLSNWLWLRELTIHLNNEYRYRYNKNINHKSFDIAMKLSVPFIRDFGLTKFEQAMPDQYKDKDIVNAYRNYYKEEKKNIASWKFRHEPEWW